jgi:ATP-dependent Clp protease protease subunit
MIISKKTSVHTMHNRANIQDKQTEATVYLYGEIGGYWGIDYLEFVKEFNNLTADVIHLRIDSSGGDVFAARAMKAAIMQHKAKVIAHIDGLAASAASFLAMGADEIEIVDGGFIMIHRASSFLDILGYFNVDDLTELQVDIGKEIDRHGKINESIANDYVKKTGNSLEQVLAWMSAETWFTAKEALDNDFVDRIYDGSPAEGSYDLSTFNNVPECIKARNHKATKREIEKALRDAGICANLAKSILAGGFKEGDLRDAAPEQEPPQASVVENQRDADSAVQREVADHEPARKDEVIDLIIRASRMASIQPTQ